MNSMNLAEKNENVELGEKLLKYEQDLSIKDNEGNSSLQLTNKSENEEMKNLLLSTIPKANLNNSTNEDIKKPNDEDLSNEKEKGIEENENEQSIYFSLISDEDKFIEKMKLESEENLKKIVNMKNKQGDSLLLEACNQNLRKVTEFLIQNKADVNYENNGETCLTIATRKERTKIIEQLLKNCNEINIRCITKDEKTPFHIAIENQSIDIIKLFLQYHKSSLMCYIDIDLLAKVIETGNVTLVDLLLDTHVDINGYITNNEKKETILTYIINIIKEKIDEGKRYKKELYLNKIRMESGSKSNSSLLKYSKSTLISSDSDYDSETKMNQTNPKSQSILSNTVYSTYNDIIVNSTSTSTSSLNKDFSSANLLSSEENSNTNNNSFNKTKLEALNEEDLENSNDDKAKNVASSDEDNTDNNIEKTKNMTSSDEENSDNNENSLKKKTSSYEKSSSNNNINSGNADLNLNSFMFYSEPAEMENNAEIENNNHVSDEDSDSTIINKDSIYRSGSVYFNFDYDEVKNCKKYYIERNTLKEIKFWQSKDHTFEMESNYLLIIKSILKRNIKVNIKNSLGENALYLACSYGLRDIVETILELGKGISINRGNDEGETPLHVACKKGFNSIVKILLRQANIDTNSKNFIGNTPLLYCVYHNQFKILNELIKNGSANLDFGNTKFETPLIAACRLNLYSFAKVLIDNNAIINKRYDINGETAIFHSVRNNSKVITSYLLSKGASLSYRNKNNQTPLDLASTLNLTNMVHILVEHIKKEKYLNSENSTYDKKTSNDALEKKNKTYSVEPSTPTTNEILLKKVQNHSRAKSSSNTFGSKTYSHNRTSSVGKQQMVSKKGSMAISNSPKSNKSTIVNSNNNESNNEYNGGSVVNNNSKYYKLSGKTNTVYTSPTSKLIKINSKSRTNSTPNSNFTSSDGTSTTTPATNTTTTTPFNKTRTTKPKIPSSRNTEIFPSNENNVMFMEEPDEINTPSTTTSTNTTTTTSPTKYLNRHMTNYTPAASTYIKSKFNEIGNRRFNSMSELDNPKKRTFMNMNELYIDRIIKEINSAIYFSNIEKLEKILKESYSSNINIFNLPTEVFSVEGPPEEKVLKELNKKRESWINKNKIEIAAFKLMCVQTVDDNCNLLKVMLRYGLNPNVQNGALYTPLHLACKNEQTLSAITLLEYNANPHILNRYNESPLFLASKKGLEKVVQEILVHSNDEVNLLNKNEETPIMIACWKGNYNISKLLIENGANINKQNQLKETPLFVACLQNKIEIVKLLLENNADTNIPNSNNETPLHVACKMNNFELVNLLIKHNANITIENNKNETPISLAKKNSGIYSYLLSQMK